MNVQKQYDISGESEVLGDQDEVDIKVRNVYIHNYVRIALHANPGLIKFKK